MSRSEQILHLAATLYPLVGLEKTYYRFRLLKVIEKVPQDNNKSIRIQRWADRLWREELHCPVYPTTHFDGTGFIIPDGNSPLVGDIFEITDVPDTVYHIEVTDKTFDVTIEDAIGNERELICRMLERPFTDNFEALKYKFWRSDWTLFFRQFPENEEVERDIVNAYRGLKFGIVLLQDSGIQLATDIRTKYVGKKSLQEYTASEKESILQQYLDLSIRADKRAYFLRDNDGVKIPCRFTGDTEKTINEYTFNSPEKITVYEYYCSRYPNITVNPNEPAVLVQDRTKEISLAVPISRLFPIFTTEYEGIRRCSIRSQMTPDERVITISTFLNEISEVTYEGIPVSIQPTYLKRERSVFIPPRLEFGNGEIHKPFPSSVPPKTNPLFDTLVMNWASSKISTLYRNRTYHNETIPNLILLYPTTLERDTRETFIRDLGDEIQKQTGQSPQIVQQRQYTIGKYERRGSSLIRILAEVRSSSPNSLAIIVLWEHFLESVHGELKEAIKPVLSQCVTERVVHSIVKKNNPRLAVSQLQNLALGVSTEAGVQPWVIADPLRHDMHIGIDLLFGQIGYHFLYGTGGRLIQQHFGKSIFKGRMQEAIKKPELRSRLEETIQSIVQDGHQIKSIIIHRDGRWWTSESLALQEAVQRLKKEGILPENFRCAVVEIRKSHLPIRLFTVVDENSRESLQNTLFGSYLILDSQRVILTTTGRPGAWDNSNSRGKTANNLLLEVVETIGKFNTQDIAEDAYYLTHLNWNAPNIEIALPVTIRWTDQALRKTFHQIEEEDDEELQEIESDAFDMI